MTPNGGDAGAPLPLSAVAVGVPVTQRIRLAFNALQVLGYDMKNELQASILNACLDTERYFKLITELQSHADGRKLLAERPSLQGPDVPLDKLSKLPEGTLGNEVARYFESQGISPFTTIAPITCDFDFIGKRYRETHDIFHVLTGYGTDNVSEMELQAFVVGNIKLPSALFILILSTPIVLKVTKAPVGDYFRRVYGAFQRGRHTRELLSVPYEQHWATPLAELVTRLGIPSYEGAMTTAVGGIPQTV